MQTAWLWPLVGVALAAGCGNEFRSIHPIALPGEALDEPRLIGDWVAVPEEKPGAGLFRITRSGRGSGLVIALMDSVNGVNRYLARPTRIGGRLILDVWEEPVRRRGSEDLQLWFSAHMPIHVEVLDSDTIVLRILDVSHLSTQLAREPGRLAHTRLPNGSGPADSTLVVTATTADIRAFLTSYLDQPGALDDDPIRLRRLR